MSGKVVGWAFEVGREASLSPTQRLVLLAYADNASERDGKCWPDKPEIVEKTGLSRATVYRAIASLEATGHLQFTEDSKGRECILLTVPWASHSETGTEMSDSHGEIEVSHSETGKSHGENRSNKGTVRNRQEPSHSGGDRPKSKVGGKSVTDAEHSLAAEIVAAFNAAAGTSVTAAAHLTPIVGRIREKPDLTADDHCGIIAAVFAVPWWDGAPGPNVIYGNAAQFERSIETWRATPAAKLRLVQPAGPARTPTKTETRRLIRTRARLRAELPESTYRSWVKQVRLAGITADTVHLHAPEEIRAWCERRYSALIAAALDAEDLPAHVAFVAAGIDDNREAA